MSKSGYIKLNKALSQGESPYYVGLVVIDLERKKILLGKRREDGIWTGPGGSAEAQENPRQAAIREAFEEANLQLRPRELKELPTQVCKNGKVCHAFLVTLDSKGLNIHSGNDPDKEVAKWEWHDLDAPLPGNTGYNRLVSINNAKMRLLGLRKSTIMDAEGGKYFDTADQNLAEMMSDDNAWVGIIRSTMAGYDYGDVPRSLVIPGNMILHLSKVEDGIYSGILIKDDPESGEHGETLLQLMKMTPEIMVQTLKAKTYLRSEQPSEPTPTAPDQTPEAPQDYKGLWSALRRFQKVGGDVHIHLTKSLQEELEKGFDAMPEGTKRIWNDQKYVKHKDGWVAVSGEHHGKLHGKFKKDATHAEAADAGRDNVEVLRAQAEDRVSKLKDLLNIITPHEPEKREEVKKSTVLDESERLEQLKALQDCLCKVL